MSNKRSYSLLGASLATHNNGVSALTASLAKLILSREPRARIVLLTGARSAEQQRLEVAGRPVSLEVRNYRLSPAARPREHLAWILLLSLLYRVLPVPPFRAWLSSRNPWLKTVLESDFIGDIWAGDSFSDIYGTARLLVGALPRFAVNLLGRRIAYLPQSYGPFRTSLGRRIGALLLRRASVILARDRLSEPVVRALAGRRRTAARMRFCPDVAFLMDCSQGARGELARALGGRSVHLVGLNISGLLYRWAGPGRNRFALRFDYRRFVVLLLERLLAEQGVEVVLVPHTYTLDPRDRVENDYWASQQALRRLAPAERRRVHLLARQSDQYEVKGLAGAGEFFAGSRLHACIGALSQGIVTVGVAYSDKFLGVFQAAGMSAQAVDARATGLEATLDRILEAYRNRASLQPALARQVAGIKQLVAEEFGRLLPLGGAA